MILTLTAFQNLSGFEQYWWNFQDFENQINRIIK